MSQPSALRTSRRTAAAAQAAHGVPVLALLYWLTEHRAARRCQGREAA
ncbi:hypothetical protein [Streptomyces sp. NPDC093261]